MGLNGQDRTVIETLQDGLPLVPKPYAALAERAGMSEADLIAGIGKLVDRDVIKRFGVVVRHHELGYRANAMVVWDIPDAEVREVGRLMASYSFVTLCYRRPRRLPLWPYNLFSMIHGKDHSGVQGLVADLIDDLNLDGTAREILFSRRRFKQRGARYAVAENT